jgi:hypothetical protein
MRKPAGLLALHATGLSMQQTAKEAGAQYCRLVCSVM